MCPTYSGSKVSSDVKTQELIVELHTVLSIPDKSLQLSTTHTHTTKTTTTNYLIKGDESMKKTSIITDFVRMIK